MRQTIVRMSIDPKWHAVVLLLALSCLALPQITDRQVQERLAKQAALFKFLDSPGSPKLEDQKPDADGVIRYEPVIIDDYMMRSEPFTAVQELAEAATNSCVVVTEHREALPGGQPKPHLPLFRLGREGHEDIQTQSLNPRRIG
jgi:hypothetical protein